MPDLDMTPYAAFVWPAWGISALVLTGLVVRVAVAARRWKAELQSLEVENLGERPQVGRSPVGPEQ